MYFSSSEGSSCSHVHGERDRDTRTHRDGGGRVPAALIRDWGVRESGLAVAVAVVPPQSDIVQSSNHHCLRRRAKKSELKKVVVCAKKRRNKSRQTKRTATTSAKRSGRER